MFEETTAAINSMKTEFAGLLEKVAVFKFRIVEGAEITQMPQARKPVAARRKVAATSATRRTTNPAVGANIAADDGSWEEFRERPSAPISRTS